MADCDMLKASADLRELKGNELLIYKGKGKATYYIAGKALSTPLPAVSTPPLALNTPPSDNLSTPPPD